MFVRSGKTDPVQFKGRFKQGPFFVAYKNGRFASGFLSLRYRSFASLEKGKLVFQKSLSETPYKPEPHLNRTGSVFTLPSLCMKETFYGNSALMRGKGGWQLSAPKSRDSLRLRRRFLPLPEKSRDFLRPQDARSPLRRKSLANRDFFCDENG